MFVSFLRRARIRQYVLMGVLFTCLTLTMPGCDSSGCGDSSSSRMNQPASRRAYVAVANAGDNSLSLYQYASNTLTPIGKSPQSVVIARTDANDTANYLYVANSQDNTISQFAVNADGTLTPLSTPTVQTGAEPVALAVPITSSSNGAILTGRKARVYCANKTGKSISVFSINNDGTLHLISTVATAGSAPTAIEAYDDGIEDNSKGREAVFTVSAVDNTLTQFTVVSDAEGGLKQATPPTVAAGAGNVAVADYSGDYVLVANLTDKTIQQFSTSSSTTGTTPINSLVFTTTFNNGPVAMSLDKDFYLFGFTAAENGTLSRFLTPSNTDIGNDKIKNVTTLAKITPQPVALAYASGTLFVAENLENSLVALANAGAADISTLTASKTVATGAHPAAVAYYTHAAPTGGNVQTTVKGVRK